jgi:hypothetical protein
MPANGLEDVEITLYGRRYGMLALFCILSVSNASMWIQFGSIDDHVRSYFGISNNGVNWLSMIYMLVYPPLCFPMLFFVDKYGLRVAVTSGAFLNALAAGLRYIGGMRGGPEGFIWVFTGQTLAGIGQLFVLGVPPLLSAVWFGDRERATATSVGVLANQLGSAVGFLSAPLVSTDADIKPLLGITFYICCGTLLLLVFLFQDHPPTPASLSQAASLQNGNKRHSESAPSEPLLAGDAEEEEEENSRAGKSNILAEIIELLQNKDFTKLMLAYGVLVGVVYGVCTLLAQLLEPFYGQSNENAYGFIGIVVILAGVPASLAAGIVLDWAKQFHLGARSVCFSVCACCAH